MRGCSFPRFPEEGFLFAIATLTRELLFSFTRGRGLNGKYGQELRSCAKSPLPLMDPHPGQALLFTVGIRPQGFFKMLPLVPVPCSRTPPYAAPYTLVLQPLHS
ncbi:Putative hypothetical protein [Helicobacter mustelae 12198]|uniref:Uncharacterized protein n=1 Tax=Helicobacter mustelae (strain ATCC 43772 / CCUG 25715 / CIP 103759 / LMG 18044 / NCTC 12198 / R85-136P) TaxID=679897 RepID=D3UJF1_HELM1|nr:Putative hypothetical protein [Helicobacter mustelae 12198]